jgi:hypothetical protein
LKQVLGYSGWGRGPCGSTVMVRKRRHSNSKNETTADVLFRFLSLLFGFLAYLINIRPRVGQYQQGFLDSLIVALTLLWLWFKSPQTKKGIGKT